jgi:hypothetical protein
MDAFTEFEHERWERVAKKYDSTRASSGCAKHFTRIAFSVRLLILRLA